MASTGFPFKPAEGYVLVKYIPQNKITKGGIHLPDAHDNYIAKGEIIASGNEDFEVGHTVFYRNVGNAVIKLDSDDYTIVHKDNVFGTLKEERPSLRAVG